MKILIASDHRGIKLKNVLIKHFDSYNLIDLGPKDDQAVDYPDYAKLVCNAVINQRNSYGILICGSGIGMSIAANRYKGIRAALCLNQNYAKLAREHNDANTLVLSASYTDDADNIAIIKTFLITNFLQGRHKNRIDKIDDLF